MYKYLFSPIRINRLEIKNRIAYPALGLLYSYDRKLNDRYVDFYAERAKGGVGLLTIGPVGVDYIGSGAGGLEAAVTAVTAGHHVEIYDRDSDIGGQLWLAGAPPHKQELLEFIRYYRAMVNKYAIPLHLNTTVTLDLIKEKAPDHVIVAEGAEPLLPPVKGLNDPSVLSAWTVLKENPPLGKNVAILGGGAVGLETALFVAAKGTLTPEVLHFLFTYKAESVDRLRELMFHGSSRVTVFEMLPKAGKDVGRSTRWVLFDNLARYGVEVLTDAKVLSIENGRITYEQKGEAGAMDFDQVIIASGSRPVNRLSKELAAAGIPFTPVGDCVRPGRINDAIHGGFLAALALTASK